MSKTIETPATEAVALDRLVRHSFRMTLVLRGVLSAVRMLTLMVTA